MLSRKLPSPGFYSGAALASPFLADITSWKIAGLLLVFWLFSGGVRFESLLSLPRRPLIVLPAAILAVHATAIVTTHTPFADAVVRELLLASALVTIAAASKVDVQFVRGFFAVIIGTALGAALLGLVKLGLQDRGFLLYFIAQACPVQYPQGTSLCGDYNVLGMLWMVAIAGAVTWRIRDGSSLSLVIITLLMAAGIGVGSRRFILLAPVIILAWLGLSFYIRGWKQAVSEAAIIALVGASSWILIGSVSAPESYERFRFGTETMTVLGAPSEQAEALANAIARPNRAGAEVIASTIDDQALGSRVEKWALGVELALERPMGMGYAYHSLFADTFVQGKFRDHPHLPIISAALIGGLPLFIMTLAYYLCLFWLTIRATKATHLTAMPLAFILATSVCFISGDAIFSIPQWMSVSLALSLVSCSPKSLYPAEYPHAEQPNHRPS